MKPTSTLNLFSSRIQSYLINTMLVAFALISSVRENEAVAQNAPTGCDKYTMLVGDLFANGSPAQVEVFQFSYNGGVSSCKLPNIGGEGMAVDPVKNIAYIANTTGLIKVYDYSTGTFKADISVGAESALDISISADGQFLFVSTYNGLFKYSTTTGAQLAFVAKNTFNNSGNPGLWGSAVSPTTGKVYVSTNWYWDNPNNSSIEMIDPSLSGAKTTIYQSAAYAIRGVTVDNSGNVWAVMFGRQTPVTGGAKNTPDRVVKFSPTGTVLATYNFASAVDPFDIAIGPDGNPYVTSYAGACVIKLDLATGQFINHIPAQAGTFGKAIAFVCGNFKCPCTFPSVATTVTNLGTCNGTTPNNNASVTLGGIQWANAADIKEGSTYGQTPLYGAGSNKTGFGTTLNLTNLKHNTTYTVRLFNGSDNCFTDVSFTTPAIICTPPPPCPGGCAGSPNLLPNGDFEGNSDPTRVANSTTRLGGASGSPTVLLEDTQVADVRYINNWQPGPKVFYVKKNGATNNPQGEYFVWLPNKDQCLVLKNGIIAQADLCPGKQYTICFKAAAWKQDLVNFVPQNTNPQQNDAKVALEFFTNNSPTNVIAQNSWTLPASPGWGTLNWQTLTYTFTYDAANPITQIIFSNWGSTNGATDVGFAIDDIQLKPADNAPNCTSCFGTPVGCTAIKAPTGICYGGSNAPILLDVGTGGTGYYSVKAGTTPTFTRYNNGTARLQMVIVRQSDAGHVFDVDITFSGESGTGTPKIDSDCPNYPSASAVLRYYANVTGSLIGIGTSNTGSVVQVTRGTYPQFQVGIGASSNSAGEGAAGWLNAVTNWGFGNGQFDIEFDFNCCAATVIASNNSPKCAGESVQLTATPSNTTGAVTYAWTGPNGYTSSAQSPLVANAAAGTYSVTITDLNGCKANASTTVTILNISVTNPGTLNPGFAACAVPADPPLLVGSAGVCSDGANPLYQWQIMIDTPGAGWVDVAGATGVSYDPPVITTPQSYWLRRKTLCGCGSNAVTNVIDIHISGSQVSINQIPEYCVSAIPANITLTANVTGYVPGGLTYVSYLWSNGATTPSITVAGPASTTTYSVTLTETWTGCKRVASSTVTVKPLPVATINTNPSNTNPVCINTNISFTATDAGAGATYAWNFGPGASPATATGIGPHNVTYSTCASRDVSLTVTLNGCISTTTKIVNTTDVTPPALVGVPSNTTAECHVIPATPALNTITATDNCPNPTVVFVGETKTQTGNPATDCTNNKYQIVRTWKATDACGNTVTKSYTIDVNDTTIPVFVTVPAAKTIQCNEALPTDLPTATDNCDTQVTIAELPQTRVNGSCPDSYTIKREFTATDNCGNVAKTTQLVTVQDTQAPNFTFVPAAVTVNCENPPTPGTPTATDNCDTQVSIALTNTVSTKTNLTGACTDNSYTVTYTWTATDNCANTKTATQVVTVQDITKPVLVNCPVNITVTTAQVAPSVAPTATDNCDNAVSIVPTEVSNPAGCQYTITRTWTASDNCNNTSVCTQVITVNANLACTTAITSKYFPTGATSYTSNDIGNDISTYNGSDGKASVTGTGGTLPYTYKWSNGQTTQEATGLPAGTYTATVTDKFGCTTSCTVTLKAPAKLGDKIFEDKNGNGIQDAGEVGIDGVTVVITGTDQNGKPVSITQVTSNGGMYMIDGLVPGTYKISITKPAGKEITAPNQGANEATDSDLDPATGMSNTVTLTNGQIYTSKFR
jgi:hypothetical protein